MIVSMLQVESIFIQTPNQSGKARLARRNFEVAEGDLLTLLNVFNAYSMIGKGEEKFWCSKMFLKYKALRRANELYSQMVKTLKRYKVPLKSTKDQDQIVKCIVSGLFPNAAYLHMSGTYRTVRGDFPLLVHPTSVLYAVEQPSWVVFTELSHTRKIHMRDLTVIDPAWLEVLAPHFYEKTTLKNY